MRKIFAIALVAVFVLGMAATAMAAHLEVTGNGAGLQFLGEYRLRAISHNNVQDGDDATDDGNKWAQQRVRLHLNAIVGDDVTVKTRYTVSSGVWNGKVNTQGVVATDHAYLVMKNFGGTFYIGLQPASWGNKFMVWGASAERIKYVAKAGDITYGGFWQKNVETAPVISGDADNYAAFVVLKPADDHKVAILVISVNDNVTANDGTILDIAYNGKAGPVTIAAEYASKDMDSMTDPQTGLFIAGNMAISDAMGVSLAYAVANDGFTSDGDFGPTLAVGTDVNATAISNFGQLAGAGDSASSIVLGVSMATSDDLTIGAKFASHALNDTTDATEIDLYANYKLATNTMLKAGYVMFDNDNNVDPATSAAVQISTKF